MELSLPPDRLILLTLPIRRPSDPNTASPSKTMAGFLQEPVPALPARAERDWAIDWLASAANNKAHTPAATKHDNLAHNVFSKAGM